MNEKDYTIHYLFETTALQKPDAPALLVKRAGVWQKVSYAELLENVRRVAAWLKHQMVHPGEMAAIVMENSPEWAAAYLGIVYAGMTCVPLDIQLSGGEIESCIRDSGAKIIFISKALAGEKLGRDFRSERQCIVVDDIEAMIYKRYRGSDVDPAETGGKAVASLIYTSGTTDRPKGVMLSHANICANFKSIDDFSICRPTDNMLAILPLHHTYPFMITMIVPLLIGARITFMPAGFKPQDLSAAIKETGVTMIVGVPQLFTLLHAAIGARVRAIPAWIRAVAGFLVSSMVKKNFGPTVRICASGGARLDPAVARDMTGWGLKVIEGYGLTEASPVVTFNPLRRVKFGSVGKPIPGVEIRINQPDSRGEGEILIRGRNVMKGYFRNEELTAQTIRDGWLYSGDLGVIDREGYLTITGRAKEVIVLSSGKNIYPEELEGHYGQSPYIKELCVIGVPREGSDSGEMLFAVIRPDFDHFRRMHEVNINDKIRWELENLAKSLAAYKHIMGFMLVKDDLPRTTLKKLRRYEVRKKYLQAQTAQDASTSALTSEDQSLLNSPAGIKVVGYISRRLKKNVALDNHLELDLGVDSLTRVEIGLGLEEEFGLSIPDDVLYAVATVRDIIIKIEELSSRGAPQPVTRQSVSDWHAIVTTPPPAEVRESIVLRRGLFDWPAAVCAKILCFFLVSIPWFLRAQGKKNVPEKGPLLICPNHASYLDGAFIFTALPLTRVVNTYFLGSARVFNLPLFRWLVRPGRVIPIDPAADLITALQAVAFVLAQGKNVCIFPEGQRSVNDEVGEFKKGVGILVKELDIPVVPVYIKGSHKSWPRTSALPRPYPVEVRFGHVLYARDVFVEAEAEQAYERITKRIREEVMKLA